MKNISNVHDTRRLTIHWKNSGMIYLDFDLMLVY